MSNSTRNFQAHGGNEWVIGGKLTFLPGAEVEGAEGLFDLPLSSTSVIPHLASSTAGTVAALRDDFNALLVALKHVGHMAQAPEPTE